MRLLWLVFKSLMSTAPKSARVGALRIGYAEDCMSPVSVEVITHYASQRSDMALM